MEGQLHDAQLEAAPCDSQRMKPEAQLLSLDSGRSGTLHNPVALAAGVCRGVRHATDFALRQAQPEAPSDALAHAALGRAFDERVSARRVVNLTAASEHVPMTSPDTCAREEACSVQSFRPGSLTQ
eukprot:5117171-Pleurochrysis_carterae.AAC.2